MNRLLLYIVFMFIAFAGHTQNGSDSGEELYDHRLDESKWTELRDGIRYEGDEDGPGRRWTYENDQDFRDADGETGGGNGENGNRDGLGSGNQDGAKNLNENRRQTTSSRSGGFAGLGILGYILIAAFIVGLVILLYYMYVNNETDGKAVNMEFDLDEVNPTEIPLTELEKLLKEALERKDYRGAVRIYFIFIVRDLSQKGWINWQKEKTNFHYLREMTGKKEFDEFNRSVSFFEIIWYGKREVDLKKFEEIKPIFTNLLNKLGVK